MPPMPQPRSGCRSCVLWPQPWRQFLPWISSAAEPGWKSSKRRDAEGFVVVLGGESLSSGSDTFAMEPCTEPFVLDMAAHRWHAKSDAFADVADQCGHDFDGTDSN